RGLRSMSTAVDHFRWDMINGRYWICRALHQRRQWLKVADEQARGGDGGTRTDGPLRAVLKAIIEALLDVKLPGWSAILITAFRL
ncbi:hypothetical protein PQR15_38430, partial [Streptomyces lydicus]|nr:hypothetical protein [Streptomyces lydicus]